MKIQSANEKRDTRSDNFFSDWLKEYYTGYNGKLTKEQIKEIEEFVEKHTVTDSREVVILIKEKYIIGIKYREKFKEFAYDIHQYETRLRQFIGTDLHLVKLTA
jgi:hypothetical protein